MVGCSLSAQPATPRTARRRPGSLPPSAPSPVTPADRGLATRLYAGVNRLADRTPPTTLIGLAQFESPPLGLAI